MEWAIPPVVRMKTADSTGYIIETINCLNVGPGGCVRMTTREFWRLSATTMSGGDITLHVDKQTQAENPRILTERRMCFGMNEQKPPLRRCSCCTSPTTETFPMRFKRSNSNEDIKYDTTKKTMTIITEDVACETMRTVLIHAESQTDFGNSETSSNPGISASETTATDSSKNSSPTSSRQTLRGCSGQDSEISNDEQDLAQNVSSENDIICQKHTCPACNAIYERVKYNASSQTDVRMKRSNNRKCNVCSGKKEKPRRKRSRSRGNKKKNHKSLG